MTRRTKRPDPIADYIEWTRHRYDPGHYLGGTLQPHLRKASLGPRARRLSGLLLGVSALMPAAYTVAAAWSPKASRWEVLSAATAAALFGTAAVRMYRSSG